MTKLLIRLFVRRREDAQNPAVRTAYGKLAGWVGIVCNLLLALSKLLAGLLSGSIAIMADAVNNLSDGASSVITLLGFRLSAKPADKEHPFGHARYEYIAGLCVAILVLIIGFELGRSSVEKIITPTPVEYGWVSLAVLGASILLKLWMAFFNRHVGRLIGSASLQATFVDSRNDVITTTAVLAAALVARFTGLALDGWIGAAVAVFIMISGVLLVKDTLNPLLGEAPDEALVTYVQNKISGYPGVLGTHDLIVHDYGPGRRFATVDVEMAGEADVMHNHEVIERIERDFLADDHIHLHVHYDPLQTRGPEAEVRRAVERKVRAVDDRLSIHDFEVRSTPKGRLYHFDLLAPADLAMDDDELRGMVERAVAWDSPGARVELVIDRSYAPIPQ